MRSLSALELIDVWERGAGQHPLDRALTLLAACCGEPREQLALAGLGRRDGLLLQAYAEFFGDKLNAFAECPQCAERLEYSLSVRELMASTPASRQTADLVLVEGEMSLQLRPVNSFDFGAASACADVVAARRVLAERCVVEATRGGDPMPVEVLPEATVERISACLAKADPQAEVLIDLVCARCQHHWETVLEIDRFFWTRINAIARRLLREVHILARVYGWPEHDILSLSPLRRQCYLELVG
jgi:hypothetical protein